MLKSLMGISKENLLVLDPQSVDWLLSEEEIVYIATVLGAYWRYDYEAAKQGRLGMHAILKSLLHSDGFFISRILLGYHNVRLMIAHQLVRLFNQLEVPAPLWVAGIPDGATELGKDVARLLGAQVAEMEKHEGRIVMVSSIPAGESLLFAEDFCTQGTGFKEAVLSTKIKNILPYELVGLNRGGLEEIVVEEVGVFKIVAAATHRVNDWPPEECPLCKMGSIPIKPKVTDENWRLITTSQLPAGN